MPTNRWPALPGYSVNTTAVHEARGSSLGWRIAGDFPRHRVSWQWPGALSCAGCDPQPHDAGERMNGLRIIAMLVLLGGALNVQAWPPFAPTGGDSRVGIQEIWEDRVTVWTPYNYGHEPYERDFMNEWAQWACGLYQRVAVPVYFYPNDASCDEMGTAAAERSSACWHEHVYVCAIPPKPDGATD